MAVEIICEYTRLLKQRTALQRELAQLPRGYISRKYIKGKEYCYLQVRQGSKLHSTYLKAQDIPAVTQGLIQRDEYEAQLPPITSRILEIEAAARVLDEPLFRRLLVLRISEGLDEIPVSERERCISFADSMCAIEGVSASQMAHDERDAWKNGKTTFLTSLEKMLQHYGFSVEGM